MVRIVCKSMLLQVGTSMATFILAHFCLVNMNVSLKESEIENPFGITL